MSKPVDPTSERELQDDIYNFVHEHGAVSLYADLPKSEQVMQIRLDRLASYIASAVQAAEQTLLALILAARPEQKTWNGVNDESGKVAAAYLLALDEYTEAIQALFRKDGDNDMR